MEFNAIIVALIGVLGAIGGAILTAFLNRRRDRADTHQKEQETKQLVQQMERDDVNYYQGRVEETIKQMVALEARVTELKKIIEEARTQYERRVGTLHTKIDNLKTELDRANETITELRLEVKQGNIVITELREEITQLLVDRAERKQDENN